MHNEFSNALNKFLFLQVKTYYCEFILILVLYVNMKYELLMLGSQVFV